MTGYGTSLHCYVVRPPTYIYYKANLQFVHTMVLAVNYKFKWHSRVKIANEITGIPPHRSTRMLLWSSSGLFNHHRFTPWLYSRKSLRIPNAGTKANCIARCGMMDIWLRNRQVDESSWFLAVHVVVNRHYGSCLCPSYYAETDPVSRTDQQGGGATYTFSFLSHLQLPGLPPA